MINFLNNLLKKPETTDEMLQNNRKTAKKKPPVNKERIIWEVNGQPINVELHREVRRGWRYAFAKGGKLIVRIPQMDKINEEKIINDIKKRLVETITQKPHLLSFFETKTYKNNDEIMVDLNIYKIILYVENRQMAVAKLKPNKIIDIHLPDTSTDIQQQKAISTLLSRVIAMDNLAEFSRRVRELNQIFFKKDLKSIRFKQNHSNWGSCSSTGNLNFSSRLLFAPIDVQDYVIIHELAHLIELNHSDRFWKLVADAMPDYETKEKWLKQNSSQCRF